MDPLDDDRDMESPEEYSSERSEDLQERARRYDALERNARRIYDSDSYYQYDDDEE